MPAISVFGIIWPLWASVFYHWRGGKKIDPCAGHGAWRRQGIDIGVRYTGQPQSLHLRRNLFVCFFKLPKPQFAHLRSGDYNKFLE